jgi:YhcH/YjgK/YiaL family protein
MIMDKIENWNLYFSRESNLYPGVEFILKQINGNIQDGRFEIEGNDGYAMVQSYMTDAPENKKLESHRRYIDIQYIVSGKEAIGWLPAGGLRVMTPYSDENDVIFFHSAESISPLILAPGMFAVFYPSDAHRPGCFLDKPKPVRKIVIKVKI